MWCTKYYRGHVKFTASMIGLLIFGFILGVTLGANSGQLWWWIQNTISASPDWLSKLASALTWPVTVTFLAVWFRREIAEVIKEFARFISNIKRVRGHGLEAEIEPQTKPSGPDEILRNAVSPANAEIPANGRAVATQTIQPQQPATENVANYVTVNEDALNELQPHLNVTMEELRFVANNFKRMFFENVNLEQINQQKTIDSLVVVSASTSILLAHERHYRQLFGSQIHLLKKLREIGPMSLDAIQQIYNNAKNTYPEFYGHYTFQSWLGFVKDSGLANTNADGNVFLTNFGNGFLKYTFDQNLTHDKYG